MNKLYIHHIQRRLHSYENVRNYGKTIIKIYFKSPYKTQYQTHYELTVLIFFYREENLMIKTFLRKIALL